MAKRHRGSLKDSCLRVAEKENLGEFWQESGNKVAG